MWLFKYEHIWVLEHVVYLKYFLSLELLLDFLDFMNDNSFDDCFLAEVRVVGWVEGINWVSDD